jgi:putative membrane protein
MTEEKKKRSLKEYLGISGAGFAMGVANVIPGVSGGTMAFILGIYEELINSIREFASVDTIKKGLSFKIKELYATLPWQFLLALGIGVVAALLSAAKLFVWLLEYYPSLTFAFFFGLVAASIITVLKKVKKWSVGPYIMLVIGAAAAFGIVNIIPQSTPNVWWLSFICGVIVICAMILPGISGSFLLLVLGQYKYVWGAVAGLPSGDITLKSIVTLVSMVAGCVVGLSAFVHLLNWLLKKFHDLTVATLIGFMIGSMWKLWPWKQVILYSVKSKDSAPVQVAADAIEPFRTAGAKIQPLVEKNLLPQNFDGIFWAAIGLVVLGVIIVFAMEYMAQKIGTEQKEA